MGITIPRPPPMGGEVMIQQAGGSFQVYSIKHGNRLYIQMRFIIQYKSTKLLESHHPHPGT